VGRVAERFATFDCYGTLIDWNSGLREALGSDELVERYHEAERELEADEPGMPYREVLTEASRRIGAPDPEGVAASPPSWEPFPEVPAALERLREADWGLVILSNTDRDYIEASMARIGVPFDFAIVASEIGSYKPALGHWLVFESEVGRPPDVHVAASLYHDIAAATALEILNVWVNRLGEEAGEDARPTREIPDLSTLPDVLAELFD
jgi:2-haloacid dehalogenase